MRICSVLVALAILCAATSNVALSDTMHGTRSLSQDVVPVYQSGTESAKAPVFNHLQSTTQASFSIQDISFGLADVDAPLAQLPVSYLLDGQSAIDGSCCTKQIPPGTEFVIHLPDATSHIETSAVNPMWGDFQKLTCSTSADQLICKVPEDEQVFFPMSIGLTHHQPGEIRVGINVNAAPGGTVQGQSFVEVETTVSNDTEESAVIDVLLLYSNSMPERFPGTRLDTEFDTWIAFSNRVLSESGIDILLRRVGIQKLDIDEDASIFQALDEARHSEMFAALRESYGADLAVLYRPLSRRESCGVASMNLPGRFLNSHFRSLAIVQDSIMNCGDGATIFLHEVGHLLGLGHSIGVPRGNAPRGYWEFSRGHLEKIGTDPDSGNEFFQGTIMSANSTNRKSNPRITCPQGFPCGVDVNNPQQADAALSLNALRHLAADAMPSLSPPDKLDLGVFVRGLEINADQVRIQLNIQNYSKIDSSESPVLLTIPAGWSLVNDESVSPSNCAQHSPAQIQCDLGPVAGFQLSREEVVLDTNGSFGSLISATLLLDDHFVANNISRYDPRVLPRPEILLDEFSSEDGGVRTMGFISFRSDTHVAMPMKAVYELGPDQELVDTPQFTGFTGFNFDNGWGTSTSQRCQVAGDRIECDSVEVKAIHDPDYDIPAFNTGGRLQFVLSGDSPAQAPEAAAPLTTLPNMLDRSTLEGRISGNFFNSERSGEGCQLTREADGETYILTCYMYESGDQVWLIGLSTLQGNRMWFEEMTITSGADFGSAFDPADVVLESWGSAELVFRDCNDAVLTWWSVLPEFEDFSVDLTKIIPVECNEALVDHGVEDYTGNYFDPNRSGEGFQLALEANRETYIATFYTYLDKKQVWLIGTGQLNGSEISFEDVVITEGAEFGSGFRAEDVSRIPFGTFKMQFTDCNNAVVQVEPTLSEFESQTLSVTRIVQGNCS